MKNILALFIFFSTIIGLAQQKLIINKEGTPPLRFFGPDDYKGFNQVWDIIQDDRGLIYIATTNSINEYDGTNWRSIALPKKNTLGRCFAKSRDGSIYLGGVDMLGYLGTDSLGLTSFVSLADLLADSLEIGIVEFVKTQDEKVFFAGRKSIHVYDKGSHSITSYNTGVKSYPNFFYEGMMCFNLSGKGIYTLKGDSLQLLTDQFKDMAISDVATLPSGDAIYIVSPTDGLYYYSLDTSYQIENKLSQRIKDQFAYKVQTLAEDYFAFSFLKGGMLITDQKWRPVLHLSKDDGVDNQVFKTFLDKDQNLWITTNTGLSVVELASVRSNFTKSNGLDGAILNIKQVENQLFVSTSEGIYTKPWNEIYDKFIPENSRFSKVPGSGIYNYSLLPTFDGVFVKGYEEIGLINERKYTSLLTKTSQRAGFTLYRDTVTSITTGANGSEIELFQYQSPKWKHVRTISNSLFPQEVFFLMYDDQNEWIWGANPNQLFRFRLSEDLTAIEDYRPYSIDDGLPSDSRNWFQEVDGQVLFATTEGLYRYESAMDTFVKDNRFENYFADKGLQKITNIPNEPSKYFYSTNNGQRGIYDKASQKAEFKMTVFSSMTQDLHYGQLGGLLGSDVLHFYQAGKQEQYNFTQKPLIRRIENITSGDTTLYNGHIDRPLIIPSDQNSIRISYAIPYFRHPEKIQYQYRLVGFDKSWSGWSTKTQKEYTNLPWGDFTFEVKAKNAFDSISEVGQYTITVNRPWYFSWWAYLGYLIMVIGFLRVLLSMNSRRLRRENQKLENTITERTQMIVAQKHAIERSLEERESLLKEIHHRVKNNLQIIASLLYLQSGRFEDEDLKRVLEEGQGRVRSMALIHQKLYENENLKSIPFEEYLMELVGEIRASFGSEMGKVKLSIDAHEIYFDVEVAIPLGLIVNELATNAFKYAFDQKENGSFSIFLKQVDGYYVLSVQDDGKGIPDEVDIRKTKSLGLRLVRMLSQQLEGDFEFSGQNGTRFELKFAA